MEKLVSGGDAMVRLPPSEGKKPVVFVPYGAPGDVVQLADWQQHKSFGRAWIQSIVSPSPDRAEPPCSVFYRPGVPPETACGGCHWQHLSYKAQTAAKKDILVEAFSRLAGIQKPNVTDTVPSPHPFRYRNKVQIPLALHNGQVIAGFYAAGSHTIVPFDDCHIQTDAAMHIWKTFYAWIRQHPGDAADPYWLRHLVIRTNHKEEAMVALVTRTNKIPGKTALVDHMMKHAPAIKSFYQNVNPKPGNVILGPRWRRLQGTVFLEERISGLRLQLSPGAFYQVNRSVAEKMYAQVAAFLDPQPGDRLMELYAGIGVMAMAMAKQYACVWCVEENRQAVEDANNNARLNGVTNLRFYQGQCEDAVRRMKFSGPLPNAVLLDPPRAGCSASVLKGVMKWRPKKIVYVSCDPATLARDTRYLSTGGYHLSHSVPFDMFPQTAHIESVSLFLKK